jgi:signal transduction histidine kinase
VNRSLRAKLALGLILPLVLILGPFTAIEYRRHRDALLQQLSLLASHSGRVIRHNVRHEMVEVDLAGVQELVDKVGQSEEFRVVYLLDPSGRVIFAPGGEGRGTQLDNRQPDCQPCHRLSPEERPASVVVTANDGQRVFRSMVPIENDEECTSCHERGQRLLGLLLTDIPMAPVEGMLAKNLRHNLLWWAGMILATLLVVSLGTSRLVIRRLRRVADTLARFGQGQLDLRLPADSADEIGQLAAAFNEMGRSIQSEEAKNRALSADLHRHAERQRDLLKRLISAQEEERRRVARDLHDDLGQELAGLAVGLQGVERLWTADPDQALRTLRQMRRQITEVTDRAYAMIVALRPSALDDLGLVPALRAQAERTLTTSGVQFELDAGDLKRRLPQELETALFRTFQEALSNVVRHAGAKQVRMSLAALDGTLEGEIADDGRGFVPEAVSTDGHDPRGLGLLGMQERMALCGGSLEILSRPGAGTRLRIRIPLPEKAHG